MHKFPKKILENFLSLIPELPLLRPTDRSVFSHALFQMIFPFAIIVWVTLLALTQASPMLSNRRYYGNNVPMSSLHSRAAAAQRTVGHQASVENALALLDANGNSLSYETTTHGSLEPLTPTSSGSLPVISEDNVFKVPSEDRGSLYATMMQDLAQLPPKDADALLSEAVQQLNLKSAVNRRNLPRHLVQSLQSVGVGVDQKKIKVEEKQPKDSRQYAVLMNPANGLMTKVWPPLPMEPEPEDLINRAFILRQVLTVDKMYDDLILAFYGKHVESRPVDCLKQLSEQIQAHLQRLPAVKLDIGAEQRCIYILRHSVVMSARVLALTLNNLALQMDPHGGLFYYLEGIDYLYSTLGDMVFNGQDSDWEPRDGKIGALHLQAAMNALMGYIWDSVSPLSWFSGQVIWSKPNDATTIPLSRLVHKALMLRQTAVDSLVRYSFEYETLAMRAVNVKWTQEEVLMLFGKGTEPEDIQRIADSLSLRNVCLLMAKIFSAVNDQGQQLVFDPDLILDFSFEDIPTVIAEKTP
jgi:hypothetical protein